jgi:hypothetical protein
VPTFEFDLTPPTITGAADIRVRAPRNTKRIRVRYQVSACANDVDGAVPAACSPKSGDPLPGRPADGRSVLGDGHEREHPDCPFRGHGPADIRRLAPARLERPKLGGELGSGHQTGVVKSRAGDNAFTE